MAWKDLVARYQQPHRGRASWQLFNTLGSYAAVWVLMYLALGIAWWATIPLVLLAGGLQVRIFIIFHDCGHGSFFASRGANDLWGFVTGLLTFTPYSQWRGEHAVHHGAAGHLDRRGTGDVWTMTVQEYLDAPRWKKLAYRMARNPLILFGVAPVVMFLFVQRVPRPGATPRERRSVWAMDLAIVLNGLLMSAIFGFLPYLLLQLGARFVAGGVGFWLFYLQHQFEDAYWERGSAWDYSAAALRGSSFIKLPRVLQWFSGNIGFHHIHHLNPRIPNYNLERCHESHGMFQSIKPMTLRSSVRTLRLRLWDESTKKLVGFGYLRRLRKQRTA